MRSLIRLQSARCAAGDDRRNLSQLIHYMARPPIAEDRLEISPTGDILYKLKEPWNDGTICRTAPKQAKVL
jgi:hypothetical protein